MLGVRMKIGPWEVLKKGAQREESFVEGVVSSAKC